MECLDIRTQVDARSSPVDDAPGSPSDVGSACDEEDEVAADSSSQCLVDVSQLSAAADATQIQQG